MTTDRLRRGASGSDDLTMPLDSIRVGERHRKAFGDIAGLAASIAEHGLLHPVVITPGHVLVAGERRLLAVKELAWTDVPVTIIHLDNLLAAEVDENTQRLNLTPSEAVAVAKALRPIEEAAARERQRDHGGTAPGRPSTGGNLPPVSAKKTRDRLAKAVGISGRTLEKAAAVVAAAEDDPQFADIAARMDATGKVDTAFRALTKHRIVRRIEQEPKPLPSGPFRVIVADPPWPYVNRIDDGTHRGQVPYPTMTLDAIRTLPVGRLAHDDAVLWLWTTNAFMEQSFAVARAWGFEPKTILTWAKDRMGVGDWLRGQTEHCLLAARGHPTITITNQTTLLHGPVREHSRKPDEFFALVEALCPGSKVELFARHARPGWQAWGAEAPGSAA